MADDPGQADVPPRATGRKLALATSLGGQAFGLLRNILVARLLGPEEFGLAAVIILTLSFLDSFSNASPHNLLFQAKDDEAKPLMAAAHAVTLGRAVITGLLLLASMGLVATVFKVDLSPVALLAVAISSFISGFVHYGIRLVQRDGDFRPGSIVQLSADFAALAVAVGAAVVTHSHVAIAFGLVGRNVVNVILSHWLSPQPYALSWSRSLLQRFWVFGWPLLINGPLLFLSAQADRMFITTELGIATLGVYTAILVLIMSPSTAIMRWLGNTNIAALAKQFRDAGDLRVQGRVYSYTALMLVLAYLMFVGFATLGGPIVALIYGHKYRIDEASIALIGCLQIVRFLRSWPSTLALSIGASGGILVSTIIRLLALPIGYLGYLATGDLPGLLYGLIIGEVLALFVSLVMVNLKANRPSATGATSLVLFMALAAVTVGCVWLAAGKILVLISLMVVMMAVGVPILAMSVSRRGTLVFVSQAMSRYLGRRTQG